MFYCLQAPVVASESNGGFNAKWDREGGIEREEDGGCMKKRRKMNMNYSTGLVISAVSSSGRTNIEGAELYISSHTFSLTSTNFIRTT